MTLVEIGRFTSHYYIRTLDIEGDYLYVNLENDYFGIIDVSDPVHPELAGFTRHDYLIRDIDVQNGYAYIVDGDDFYVIDVTDPENPFETGNLHTWDCDFSVAVQGDYAYISSNCMVFLTVVDISDPSHPEFVLEMPNTHRSSEVKAYDNILLLTGNNYTDSGIHIVDITDPENPFVSAYYDSDEVVFFGADFDDEGNIYCTQRYSFGVYQQDLFELASGSVNSFVSVSDFSFNVTAYPNPFNASTVLDFALPTAAPIKIIVYDIMGREVARLVEGFKPAGSHSVTWNAEGLSSGVYFARLEAGDFRQTRKVLLVK